MRKIEGHDKRRRRENVWCGIIIHHTGVGGRENISRPDWWRLYTRITTYLAKKDSKYVSVHFIVSREGSVTQIIDPDKYEAFHAGKSQYYHPIKRKWVNDWNRYAIGIELVGDGNLHKYHDKQYNTCARLCRDLMDRFPDIDPRCITGHENIAPGRKQDPGKYFDWDRLFKLIF